MLQRKDPIIIIAHLYFLVMIALSVIFAEDRLCRDPAYYLFRIINERGFIVEHYRFTTVITQVCAVVGVWLQLPLRWVMRLYSINDYVFYYAIFLLLAYYFKNAKWLFIYLICISLGTDYLFFMPGMILIMGMALMIIFFAFLEQPDLTNYKHWLVLLLLQLLALYSYPTLFIPLLFLLFLLFLQKNISLRILIILSVFAIVILGLKTLLKDPYEAGVIHYVFSKEHYSNVRSKVAFGKWESFVLAYLKIYWPLVLLSIVGIAACIKQKRYLQLFFGIVSIKLVVIFLIYSNSNTYPGVYFERLQYLVIPLVSGWFVLNIMPFEKAAVIVKALIILFLFYNVFSTFAARAEYHARIEKITAISNAAKQTGGRKFVLDTHEISTGPDIDDWSLSIESMLYSSLSSPDSTVTIYRMSDESKLNKPIENINADDYIFRFGDVYADSSLNQRYFRLPVGKYVVLAKD